jgi:hypothetical protein
MPLVQSVIQRGILSMSDLKYAMPLDPGTSDHETTMPPDMPLAMALCIEHTAAWKT